MAVPTAAPLRPLREMERLDGVSPHRGKGVPGFRLASDQAVLGNVGVFPNMNPPDATPTTVPVPPELPGKRDRVSSRRFMVTVFMLLSLPLLGKYDVPLPESGPLPEPMRELIAAHVAMRAEHRAAVREAIQRPSSVFPVRYADGYRALMPHLAWLKKEQSEFQLECIDAVERRDTATALASIDAMVRVSQTLAGEPTLIGQLIRIRGYQEALTEIGRLLSAGPLDAAALERLEKMVVGLTTDDAFRRAIVTERIMAMDILEHTADDYSRLGAADDPIDLPWYFRVMWRSGMTVIDRARLLESSEQLLGMVDMDPTFAAMNWEALVNSELSDSRLRSLCPVTSVILKGTRTVGVKFVSMEGRRRVALIVIAVERFRAVNGGRLPRALEELPMPMDPELREDPYSDELIYRPLPEGYAVYSVGPDRKDDRGRPPRRKPGPALPADDVITVRR